MKYELEDLDMCRGNGDTSSRATIFRIINDHEHDFALWRANAISQNREDLSVVYTDQSLYPGTVVSRIESRIHKRGSFGMIRSRLATDNVNTMHVEKIAILMKWFDVEKLRHCSLYVVLVFGHLRGGVTIAENGNVNAILSAAVVDDGFERLGWGDLRKTDDQ